MTSSRARTVGPCRRPSRRTAALRIACALTFVLPMASHAQATIRGVVHDSMAGTVLRSATIRVVPVATPWTEGFATTSDTAGRFALAGLESGRYLIGFSHPRLDSLGFDAVSRVFEIASSGSDVTLILGVPSARSIARALCGDLPGASGVLFGRVYRAENGQSASSGRVTVTWRELSLDAGTRRLDERRLQATVADDGRYVLCGVPTDVTVSGSAQLLAPDSSVSASTGAIDLAFGDSSATLYRSFVVGSGQGGNSASDGTAGGNALAQLAGRITDDGGRPMVGARIAMLGAGSADSVALTDSLGRFRLSVSHGGTYSLAISKIGFTPARHSVDLLENDTVRVAYALSRQAFELEGVTVSARASMEQAGFDRRRASRSGFFLDRQQIASSGAIFASQLLISARMLMQWGSNEAGRPVITGPLQCTPLLFVDGVPAPMPVYRKSAGNTPFTKDQSRLGTPDAAFVPDLDNALPLADVGGVEVYAPGEAPARFADPYARCSSIVIWSRALVRH